MLLKKKKIHNDITDDLEIPDSHEDNSDEYILEKIQIKKNSDEGDSSKEDCSEEDSSKEDPNTKN